MNLALSQGAANLELNGSGISGAVAGARFADADMRVLEVALQGTPALTGSAVSAVSAYLAEAARTFRQPAEAWVYLRATLPDGTTWRSALRGGSLTPTRGAAGRHLNAQVLRVELQREGWWEENEARYAALSNRHGASSGAGGLVVYNHNDAGHQNFIDIDDVGGDLPAPALLVAKGSGMGGVEACCGLSAHCARDSLETRFEGEAGSSGAGVTLAVVSDVDCSGGSYASLTWSGSAEVLGCAWGVSGVEAGALNGRVFRPLLRLRSTIAGGERLWLTLQVGYNFAGAVEPVFRCESVLVPESRRMVALPPVQLPPWPVSGGLSENMEIDLVLQAESSGAHAFNLDQMLLLAADSFVRFIPAVSSYPTFELEYDSQSGLMKNAGRSFASHIAEGPGIWLVPGRAQRLFFAFRQGAGWNIQHAPLVNLLYRQRRRVL